MKVEIDGKTYCVETLIFDNKRLREEVIASVELHRLVLDMIRAEIEQYQANCNLTNSDEIDCKFCDSITFDTIYRIIDKYRNEVNHEADN